MLSNKEFNNESEARQKIKELVAAYYRSFKAPAESKEDFKPGDRISYASKIRLFASLEGQKLDAVLMSRQAYDIMSQSGYLLPLPDLLSTDPVLAKAAEPFITENAVILSDNNIEYLLNEADERETVTEDVPNALALNSLPLFEAFEEPVYLGFAGNTPRKEACLKYLSYLLSAAK